MTIKCSAFLDVLPVVHFVLWSGLFLNCSLGTVPHQKGASRLLLLIAHGDLAILCLNTDDLAPYPVLEFALASCSSPHCHGWISLMLNPKCHLGSVLMALLPSQDYFRQE